MIKKAMFLFHRDLRLDDNIGLIEALKANESVIPIFIFDDRQLATNNQKNDYKSNNLVEFMIESLEDLNTQLKNQESQLYFFKGLTNEVIEELIVAEKIEKIYSNIDYTPFSQLRDKQISDICKKHNVEFIQTHDSLLNPPQAIHKDDGKPYTIFTPFYNKSMCVEVGEPIKNNYTNYHTKKIESSCRIEDAIKIKKNPNLFVHGGRTNALKILKDSKRFIDYPKERDNPAIEKTTGLSAHNKFGTISIREVYHMLAKTLGMEHTLIKQLYWRDFLTHIAFHFPHIFGHAFDKRFENVKFENDKNKFEAWCKGQTGFPIVDAGIRQLIATGFMHNRVRMIVASFLVKDLHIDWRWGEKFFAQHLIDYDPAVNNGNWQWASSTGCDAQPYFRIFNPWLQQERFDPDCTYIKRWIPELKNVSAKTLNELHKHRGLDMPSTTIYPTPIVNHGDAKDVAKTIFEDAKSQNSKVS